METSNVFTNIRGIDKARLLLLRKGTKEYVTQVYDKEVQLATELQGSNFAIRMNFVRKVYVEDDTIFTALQKIIPLGSKFKRNTGDLTRSTRKWLKAYEEHIDTLSKDYRGSILINELL